MYYCPKCQVLSSDKTCPSCGGKKLREPLPDDPVLLITADEMKASMIEAALEDHSMPCEERICGLGGPPAVLVGKSAYTNKNIFVPYGKLEAARDLLIGIGIADNSDQPDNTEDGAEEMSPHKRVFWRIISVLLFILAVWGIVTAADYAANSLKDILSNL